MITINRRALSLMTSRIWHIWQRFSTNRNAWRIYAILSNCREIITFGRFARVQLFMSHTICAVWCTFREVIGKIFILPKMMMVLIMSMMIRSRSNGCLNISSVHQVLFMQSFRISFRRNRDIILFKRMKLFSIKVCSWLCISSIGRSIIWIKMFSKQRL